MSSKRIRRRTAWIVIMMFLISFVNPLAAYADKTGESNTEATMISEEEANTEDLEESVGDEGSEESVGDEGSEESVGDEGSEESVGDEGSEEPADTEDPEEEISNEVPKINGDEAAITLMGIEPLHGSGQNLDFEVEKIIKNGQEHKNPAYSGMKMFFPGQIIEYEIIIKNTGNKTLKDIEITDSMFPGEIKTIDNIPKGKSKPFSYSYQVPYDMWQGVISNIATVSAEGNHGQGNKHPVIKSSNEVKAFINSPFYIAKNVKPKNPKELYEVGDEIEYIITIVNQGVGTLKNIRIDDPLLGIDNVSIPDLEIGPGEHVIIYSEVLEKLKYTITNDIIPEENDGIEFSFENIAKVTVDDTYGENYEVRCATADVEISIKIPEIIEPEPNVIPDIKIEKTVRDKKTSYSRGDEVIYVIKVTNTSYIEDEENDFEPDPENGPVPAMLMVMEEPVLNPLLKLTNVVVTDPLLGFEFGPFDLEEGESREFILDGEDIFIIPMDTPDREFKNTAFVTANFGDETLKKQDIETIIVDPTSGGEDNDNGDDDDDDDEDTTPVTPTPGGGGGGGTTDDDDDEDIDDEPTPLTPAPTVESIVATVTNVQDTEEIIDEEEVPLTAPIVEEVIDEEPVPLAAPAMAQTLPRTSGTAPELLYGLGAFVVALGVKIRKR